ncbi:MAG: glycosyltransferase family 9 protein [Alphaproteobacteria bacterium]|nr:glycosyltransferase family 9 protein [Alphaproteobacteria bacterium]
MMFSARRAGAAGIRSILVYVTSGADNALGENVLKLPLLLALKQAFPAARITWVPGTSGSFFLANHLAPLVDGRIDEFITDLDIPADPCAAARMARRRGHPIVSRHFDLIVDTQRYIGRTLFLRRIPHRRFISGTWLYAWSDAAPPRPLLRRPPALADKMLGLAAAATGRSITVPNPIPIPEPWRRRAAELLPPGRVYIGLSPGAGNKDTGKCWPLDGFITVARRQVGRGRVPVFFLGPDEREWLPQLRAAVPEALFPEECRAGDTPPISGPCLVTALGEMLSVAVANCSGTGHLLAAGGAPMVSLFGPTRPEKYAPFAQALICLKAQDYGTDDIAAIPHDVVAAAVERHLAIGRAARGAAVPTSSGMGEAPALVGAHPSR